MGQMIKVRDKARDITRLVTAKAYAAQGPKVYEKIGFVEVDAQGNEIGEVLPNSKQPQVQRSVRGAAPVVVRQQLVEKAEPEASQPEVTENKQTEPQAKAEPAPIKRRPGRQPGSKNKSISSNSTADEK